MKIKSVFPAVFMAAALAVSLFGCGGGGGGGDASAPPPPASTTKVAITPVLPASAGVVVDAGAVLSAKYNITDGSYTSSTATLECGTKPVAVAGKTTIEPTSSSAGTIKFTPDAPLYGADGRGGGCSIAWTVDGVPKSADSTLVTKVAFNTNPAVLHYTDKIYVTRTGGSIFVATKTGVTPVKNMTSVTTKLSDGTPSNWLGGCMLYETPIENGIVPAKCLDTRGDSRLGYHRVYMDPTTNEQHDYVGSYVFDETKFHEIPWGTDMPYAAHGIGTKGSYAEVADGIFYIPRLEVQTLKFSDYGFTTTAVVATGSGLVEGTFKIVMKYSN